MSEYRVRKSNISDNLSSDDGAVAFIRVSSNSEGTALVRVPIEDLEVVVNTKTGQTGRRGTLIDNIQQDPSDDAWVICSTKDVIIPDGSWLGPESDWQTA